MIKFSPHVRDFLHVDRIALPRLTTKRTSDGGSDAALLGRPRFEAGLVDVVSADSLAVDDVFVSGVEFVAADGTVTDDGLAVPVVIFAFSRQDWGCVGEDLLEFGFEECQLVGEVCWGFQRAIEDLRSLVNKGRVRLN